MWDDDEEDGDVIVDFVTLEELLKLLQAEDDAAIAHTLKWNRTERAQRLN
jgi:hypothetical protein